MSTNQTPAQGSVRIEPVTTSQFSAHLDMLFSDVQAILGIAERSFDRQGAYIGRLILLDGATLTLTFTALGFIGAKLPAGHQFVRLTMLFWAWSLLVVSMVLCMLVQKLLLLVSSHGLVSVQANLVIQRFTKLLTLLNQPPTSDLKAVIDKIEKATTSKNPRVKRIGIAGNILLILAELCTVSAFTLLLVFMARNLMMVVGTS